MKPFGYLLDRVEPFFASPIIAFIVLWIRFVGWATLLLAFVTGVMAGLLLGAH